VSTAVPRASFSTDRPVCFIATRAELRAALPGWRTPLPAAVERRGVNPFTGVTIKVRTRDPGPDQPVTVPASLPFEHVLLPNEEDWESRYVALDLALAGEEGRAPDHFREPDALNAIIAARGLDQDALVGESAQSDPRWVLVVPQQVVSRLDSLEEGSLGAALEAWNRCSPTTSTFDDLRDLWSLAKRAIAQRREMFLWLDAPPHRCSRHRPHRGSA